MIDIDRREAARGRQRGGQAEGDADERWCAHPAGMRADPTAAAFLARAPTRTGSSVSLEPEPSFTRPSGLWNASPWGPRQGVGVNGAWR